MSTQLEIIQDFMKSLDKTKKFGENAINNAISASSPFRSLQDVREALVEDCGTNAKDAEDFLKTYCGINLNTKDTGAVTGAEMGGKTKTVATIIPESGELKTSFQDSAFTVNDLSVKLADSKTFKSLSESEQFIWQGLYTWWMEGALNLISKSYGENFGFGKKSSATIKTLAVEFIDDIGESAISISNLDDAEATELKLTINMHDYASLKEDYEDASDKANSIANTEFDRAVAHELAYAVMRANITYDPAFKSLSGFVIEGLAELITGIKDTNADGIKNLAGDVSQFEVGLDEKNLGRYEDFMHEGGYLFFRYLAKQSGDLTIANKTADTIVRTFYGNDTITNYASNVTILSNGHDSYSSGNDVIYLRESVSGSSVSSGKGKDYISIYAKTKNNSVSGGAGNDTINSRGETALINGDDGSEEIYLYSTATNNTVNGGKGNDFIGSSATSALINGEDGNDYINIYSAAASNTIYGGKGNDTVFLESDSSNHRINTGEGKDVVHNEASNVSIAAEDGDDYIQSRTGENVTILGGDGNDSIYCGVSIAAIDSGDDDDYIHIYAEAVKNTVTAGAGNDTIKSYSETGILYQYASGDGDDYISGFTAKDTLSISEGKFSSATSGDDVIITVGNSEITLEGAAKLSKVNVVDAASLTNLTITDSTKSSVTIDSSIKVVDATKRTKAIQIIGNALANSIKGGTANDTLYGGKGNDTLIGGKGNDSLFGNAGNDRLYGNAGNDTLRGNAGNDSLWGGDGKDVFIGGVGNDVIQDYTSDDRIVFSVALNKASVSGSDVVFTFENGSLKVKGAKGQSLSITDSSGKSFSTVLGGSSSGGGSSSSLKTLTVTNSTSSPVTVSSAYGTINAASRTTAVKITGNKLDNTISGGTKNDTIQGGAGDDQIVGNAGNDSLLGNAGNDKIYGSAGNDKLYGNSGNDSLWGGAGNDSLWGGDGTDMFTFLANNGTDYVMDYESGELLRIYNSAGTKTATFSKSAFSNSKLTLTIDGGGSIILSNVTKSTAFNINGTSYKISGSKLVTS